MDEVLKAAENLAQLLSESPLYGEYRRCYAGVAENAGLLDFKKKQAELELKRLQGQLITFEEEKYISHLYAELSLNDTVRRFLVCEEAFLNMYRQVQELIGRACEIETFF